MKRISLVAALAAVLAINAWAIPALRQWRTVTQPDGTSLELMLVGDENLHYFVTRDGAAVVTSDGVTYCYADLNGSRLTSSGVMAHEQWQRSSAERAVVKSGLEVSRAEAPRQVHARKAAPQRAGESIFTGTKRAIVILAKFIDKSFVGGDDGALEFYGNMLNQHGFNTSGAEGSVNDYFAEMSRRQFDLQFDVYGPVRVSKSATYYGGPSVWFGGFDYAGEFIDEAIEKADAEFDIDWTVYDWNNDGEVEQVFVLYSGYGQATGGDVGTIWPHAWTLDDAYSGGTGGHGGIVKDGKYINQYACGNELYNNRDSVRMGMGVFCHEFSHCMGLPDMYDTKYGGNYGMDDWDLLDHGSYNGPSGIGECPAGWTAYERNFAGWLDYSELKPGQEVTGMKGLTDGGEAYIIYNEAHPDEYYLLENRRQLSFDKYLPEEGLLIVHVDYDPLLWENNVVNSTGTFKKSDGYTANFTNDHPRMTMFHKLRSVANDTYYDAYPIVSSKLNLDSLTDNSKPASSLYNPNTDGSLLMHKPITHIARGDGGTISFVFMEGSLPEPLRGDINGDGSVDVIDLNIAIDMALGIPVDPALIALGDLNGDGSVDAADLSLLIDIILLR